MLIAFTQSYEEGPLKACNLLCSTDQAGFAVRGSSADETRELAQGFYWKTLEASATSSAIPLGAEMLGFVWGEGEGW